MSYPEHCDTLLECDAEGGSKVLDGVEGILLRYYLQLMLEPVCRTEWGDRMGAEAGTGCEAGRGGGRWS